METYSNYQQIVQDIYEKYNPENLEEIPSLMDEYQGNETTLINRLFTIYSIEKEEQQEYFATNTYTMPEAEPSAGKVIAVIVMILFACIIGYLFYDNQTSQQTSISKYTGVVDTISAFRLQRKYESNEVSADNQYTNKPIVVKGIIGTIAKSDDGSFTYITVTAGGSSKYPEVLVQCILSAKCIAQIANVQSGMPIAIVGMNLGKKIVERNGSDIKLHHLLMTECVIVSTDDNMMF